MILAEVGGTLQDAVKVTVFIRDMRNFEAIHAVRRQYFPQRMRRAALLGKVLGRDARAPTAQGGSAAQRSAISRR